jgi:predicted secreted hydrolase
VWSNLLAVIAAFSMALAPYTYQFPRDHFSHDSYRVEWWYFTGHLQTAQGRRFGYELTFFRFALRPQPSAAVPGRSRWLASQYYSAHMAITDEAAGKFVYDVASARDALGQGGASEHALDAHVNGWSLRGNAAVEPTMSMVARSVDGDALDLRQIPLKPPAIHGSGGISRKGACASCASHYYSFTRLRTSGTVTRSGVRYAVTGISWMDHEYGSDELEAGETGWDWFSIQLDDGREIMLYRLRRADGSIVPESSGSLIARDGRVTYLPRDAVTVAATDRWVSPHTGATYPSGWRVHVNGVAATLDLVPILRDQELAGVNGTTYWEGAVDAIDAQTRKRIGAGYVELTGYAGTLKL